MSRTRRKVPGKLKVKDYDDSFMQRIKNGLVAMSKPRPMKNGSPSAIDEIWGPKAKQLSKRLRARYNRRISHEEP